MRAFDATGYWYDFNMTIIERIRSKADVNCCGTP